MAARQAERKLEESKQEASQLRNRLIIVEKNALNTSKTGETAAMNDSELTSYLFIYFILFIYLLLFFFSPLLHMCSGWFWVRLERKPVHFCTDYKRENWCFSTYIPRMTRGPATFIHLQAGRKT